MIEISKNIISSLEKLDFSIDSDMPSDILSGIDDETCKELSKHMLNMIYRASQDIGHIRLIENGRDLHPANFYDARVGDGLILHSQIRDRVVHDVLSRGGTVVIDHINDISPAAQAIQEYIESVVDGNCWIQCYITKSDKSAFNLHQDTHPFLIIQIEGKKNWKHLPNSKNRQEEVTYNAGDIAFYPRNFAHDVSGTGELSIHLTIAFDNYSSFLDSQQYKRRRGTGLPYSIGRPVNQETPARLAIRKKSWSLLESGKLKVDTGVSTIVINGKYESVLEHLHKFPSTTPLEISQNFNLDIAEVTKFWDLGYKYGLLFNQLID